MSRGVFSHVHALWRHAAADGELARELLGAVANLTAGCAAAKRAAVEEVDAGDGAKPVSLAERMLRLAFRNTAPATTSRLALAPLAALATEPAARRWLLRSAFIAKTTEQFKTAVRRGDARRQVATLRALADVAGGGGEEGRREVLRVGGSDLVQLLLETLAAAGVSGGSGPDEDEEDDIDIILSRVPEHARTVFQPQLPVAALEALLLLRNLCFHDEAKAHVAANPRALDALVAAAGATDAGARAAAADALLALVHNGQRVAALLRAGRRPARIRRAARPRVSRGDGDRRRQSRGGIRGGGRVCGRGGRVRRRRRTPASASRRSPPCSEWRRGVIPSWEAAKARRRIPRCWTLTTRDWIASPRSVPTDSPSDRSGCIRRASGM